MKNVLFQSGKVSKFSNNIEFARFENGPLVHISEADPQRKDSYFCPSCSEVMTMRLGDKMSHHFAHRAQSKCAAGGETMIHLQCKELIPYKNTEQKFSYPGRFGLPFFYSNSSPGKNCRRMVVTVGKIWIEHPIIRNGVRIVPDMIVQVFPGHNGRSAPKDTDYSFNMCVEIRVHHAVDRAKRAFFKRNQIPCLEVDMRGFDPDVMNIDDMDIMFKYWLDNKTWIQPPTSDQGFTLEAKPISKEQTTLIAQLEALNELQSIQEQALARKGSFGGNERFLRAMKSKNINPDDPSLWITESRGYDFHFRDDGFIWKYQILVGFLGGYVRRGVRTVKISTIEKWVSENVGLIDEFDSVSPHILRRCGVDQETLAMIPNYKTGIKEFSKELQDRGYMTYVQTPEEHFILNHKQIANFCDSVNKIKEIQKEEGEAELQTKKMTCIRSIRKQAEKELKNDSVFL